MIDQRHVDRGDGPGEWTPGAKETQRFREDLYFRIAGTAETMNRMLDGQANIVIFNLEKAPAEGNLHEEPADVEMVAFCDSVEHSRFTYNWALVMLAARVLDTLKTWSSNLAVFNPRASAAVRVSSFALAPSMRIVSELTSRNACPVIRSSKG